MSLDKVSISRSSADLLARPQPALSWSAIWAGASVTVAVSLLLTLAAAGLGYTVSYPGLASRSSLTAFTPAIGAGAITIQVLASALGGYLAGRLRTTWLGVHGDESHFRDTAHGLIAWAVATLGGVFLAATVIAPYGAQLAGATSTVAATPTAAEAERAAHIAGQSSLFIAIGMLLSAFVAVAAARLGGLQHEAMHAKVEI